MVALDPVVVINSIKVEVPEDLKALKGRGSGRWQSFRFGVIAASIGQTIEDDCPYEDKRGSAAFRKSWIRGFEAYHRANKKINERKAS